MSFRANDITAFNDASVLGTLRSITGNFGYTNNWTQLEAVSGKWVF